MNDKASPDEDQFMAQFSHRLRQEPPPAWATRRKREFPWQELGWALAASLMLFLHWTELRFGLLTLRTVLIAHGGHPKLKELCLVMAAGFALWQLLAPAVKREVD